LSTQESVVEEEEENAPDTPDAEEDEDEDGEEDDDGVDGDQRVTDSDEGEEGSEAVEGEEGDEEDAELDSPTSYQKGGLGVGSKFFCADEIWCALAPCMQPCCSRRTLALSLFGCELQGALRPA
jgi:hypothetical protein